MSDNELKKNKILMNDLLAMYSMLKEISKLNVHLIMLINKHISDIIGLEAEDDGDDVIGDSLRLHNARQGIKFELYPPHSQQWEELTLEAQNEWAKLVVEGVAFSEVACRFIAENTPVAG